MSNLKVLAVLLCALTLGALAAWAVQTYLLTIPTTGQYQPGELVASPSSIDWGPVTTGIPVIRIVNLTNYGEDIGSLNMTVSDVVNLTSYSLVWDVEGWSLLNGEELIDVSFNLTVYDCLGPSFSFNIQINDKS